MIKSAVICVEVEAALAEAAVAEAAVAEAAVVVVLT